MLIQLIDSTIYLTNENDVNCHIFCMQEECSVCYLTYNDRFEKPILLCKYQHSACQRCAFQSRKKTKKCPHCSQIFGRFTRFKLYKICEESLKIQNQTKSEKIEEIKNEFTKCYLDILLLNIRTPQFHYSQLREEAKTKMKQGNYQLAAAILKEVFLTYFDIADNEEFLGLGSRHELSYTELSGCHYYWNLHGENLSLLDQLTICLCQMDYNEKVRQWFDQMSVKQPYNFKILFCWATIIQNNRFIDKAKQLYLSSLELNTHFYKTELMLAFVYDQAGQQIEAIRFAKKVILKDPQNMFALFILTKSKQNSHINRTQLGQFFSKNFNYLEAMLYIADCYQQQGRYDKSIELYKKCAQKQPFNRLLDIKIGICLAFQRKYDAALQYLNSKKYEIHKSDKLLALQCKGYCFVKQKKYFEAWHQFRDRLVECQVAFAHQQFLLATIQCYYQLSRFQRALKVGLNNYDKIKLTTTTRLKIYWYMSASHFHKKQFQRAIYWADKCSWQLKSGTCYFMLAINYHKIGNFEQSIRFYKIASQMNFYRFKCFETIAKIYEKQKAYEQSLIYWKKIESQEKRMDYKQKITIKITHLQNMLSLDSAQ